MRYEEFGCKCDACRSARRDKFAPYILVAGLIYFACVVYALHH